jgi:hypothetical protein
MPDSIVVHENPAWKERADFIIAARIDGGEGVVGPDWEQIWARQLGPDRFQVCCIPFFVRNLALGDVVQTKSEPGKRYVVQRVVARSGHYTFHVWFFDDPTREKMPEQLRARGCLIERRWEASNLLAIDAPSAAIAEAVADVLSDREQAGLLEYQTGRTEG